MRRRCCAARTRRVAPARDASSASSACRTDGRCTVASRKPVCEARVLLRGARLHSRTAPHRWRRTARTGVAHTPSADASNEPAAAPIEAWHWRAPQARVLSPTGARPQPPRRTRPCVSPGVGTGSDGCRTPPDHARPTRRSSQQQQEQPSCALGADASQCAVSWAAASCAPTRSRRGDASRSWSTEDIEPRVGTVLGKRVVARMTLGAQQKQAGSSISATGRGQTSARSRRRRTQTSRWTRPGF